MATRTVHVRIEGRVQGVGFRASASWAARRIGGLAGWVRNLDDGRVEALVEGPREKVDDFLAWCRQGPPHARVDDVAFGWEPADGTLGPFGVGGDA